MTMHQAEDGEVITGPTVIGRAMGGGGLADSEMARRAGLRGSIVSNLFHFAQVTDMLVSYFSEDWFSNGAINLTYLAPLNDGEGMTPKARVLDTPAGDDRTVLSIWCENDRGEVLAKGEASCLRRG